MVKPSDFFVTITDFFAILLPGALLTFLLSTLIPPALFGEVLPPLGSAARGWAAFLIAAFVLGHVVSTLGGPLDPLADWLSEKLEDLLARLRRPPASRALREHAKTTIGERVDGEHASFAEKSGFMASYLRQRNAAAAAEIERLQSISRFFRSLLVVLVAAIVVLGGRDGASAPVDAAIDQAVRWSSVLALFSFWLFAYQRWRRKQAIFANFVALTCVRSEADGE